jgi:acyl-CoA thioesterase-2
MSSVLDELVALLALERLEHNLFRGQSQDLGWGLVFGGQVLGQALSAAGQTVDEGRPVHSLHGYFLRPGIASKPIIYDVDRIRDGKSFTTRRVVAIQDGRPIFNMSASFQTPEVGFEHQAEMPKCAGPDGLKNEHQAWLERLDRIPKTFHKRVEAERPIEIRDVDPVDPLQPEVAGPSHDVWVKASGPLADDPALHRYLLAYCSDFAFMTTSLRPHRATWLDPTMQVASLDHAMWFHRPFRMDEWLLHSIDSPSASGARGLVRGSFFTRDGELVASTAQEGLIRRRTKKP